MIHLTQDQERMPWSTRVLLVLGLLLLLCFTTLLVDFLIRPGHYLPVPKAPMIDAYWKNRYNQEVFSRSSTEAQFAAEQKVLLDSIAGLYRTKPKYIRELVTLSTESHTILSPVPGAAQVDSSVRVPGCPAVITQMRDSFANRWYTARVGLGAKRYLEIWRRDSLTALWKDSSSGHLWWKKQYLVFNASFADTSTHITGATTFRRQVARPSRYGLSVGAGYGLLFTSAGVTRGPVFFAGLTYTPIRF